MTERFVVIGAGTMGTGIAYVAAGAGYHVELIDVAPTRTAESIAVMAGWWEKAITRGKLTPQQAAVARERVRAVPSLAELTREPAVVVEAVPERVDLKVDVLASAEAVEPVLLASNTSSIPIGTLAAGLKRPDRFCGLHFFNPVWAMALIEVVIGSATSDVTRERALEVVRRLGKEPVVVADAPGFATSRLGVALGLEAIRMVADGVASPADIDKAMTLGYRHPVGPLELTDLVGLDVRLDIARTLAAAYGDRFAPPPLLEHMVAEGKLGRKTGEGFYRWVDGKRVEDTSSSSPS